MDKRDAVFDLLVEIAEYTHGAGLPQVSAKIEEALDVFLIETGRLQVLPAPRPGEATFQSVRGGRREADVLSAARRARVQEILNRKGTQTLPAGRLHLGP